MFWVCLLYYSMENAYTKLLDRERGWQLYSSFRTFITPTIVKWHHAFTYIYSSFHKCFVFYIYCHEFKMFHFKGQKSSHLWWNILLVRDMFGVPAPTDHDLFLSIFLCIPISNHPLRSQHATLQVNHLLCKVFLKSNIFVCHSIHLSTSVCCT